MNSSILNTGRGLLEGDSLDMLALAGESRAANMATEEDDTPGNTDLPGKRIKRSKSGNTAKSNNSSKPSKVNKKGKSDKRPELVPMTYKLPPEQIEQIRRVAYWRRLQVQEVVSDALAAYLSNIPKKHLREKPER